MTLSVRLQHRFAGFDLDIGFDAPPGVTALFGRSGSGKTTIVNAVAGLLRPDRGQVVLDGVPLTDTGAGVFVPAHRRRIGYVFQDARLFPHLTVRRNLVYGRWFAPRGAGPQMDRIVDLLGLGPLLQRRPMALSGGEKARVALGRAILSNPRLLLMDEPLAALDEPRRAEILPYLERLRDHVGLPILYVSHSVAEVARLATTVVLVDAGRIAAAGPAGMILSDPATAPVLGLRETGAILPATVAVPDDGDGLMRLSTPAGPLFLPRIGLSAGTALRLRILAQDVMLATQRPIGISALNILQVRVTGIRLGEGPGALVQLDAGGAPLLARVTRRSVAALGLYPGMAVLAVLKSVSVAQDSIGQDHPPGAAPFDGASP